MKNIKVEWCENFIRSRFSKKHHPFAGNPNAGIEIFHFWDMAEAAGLWERGTYNTPMSQALENLCTCDSIHNDEGDFLYNVFRLK